MASNHNPKVGDYFRSGTRIFRIDYVGAGKSQFRYTVQCVRGFSLGQSYHDLAVAPHWRWLSEIDLEDPNGQ